ncbi:hypothetical protein FZF11_19930 [Vibrio parahaemolyticus]|uniref:hypothetical protein n=2 Tax=Vibrio parahaemolyticus TaxID=670 RepID=UPI0012987AC0|nr:hypothetical protein [Vibrio parahaemolyticus]
MNTPMILMMLTGTFLLSAPALAEIEETSSMVPKNLHIYDVQGSTFVDLPAHGCSGARYYLDPNHPKYDAILSILLSAQLAGEKVVVRFDGCINNNTQGRIVGVYLKSS